MVLLFGRYTFDGNALPRPQFGDEFGGQLIGHAKRSDGFAVLTLNAVTATWLLVRVLRSLAMEKCRKPA